MSDMEDFLKKLLPVPKEMLDFRDDKDFKRFKRAMKNYETNEFNKFIGKIIKDKRKELDILPTDIAGALYITYSTYYNYESGNINIPPQNLFKIAKILNISLNKTK